MPPALIGIIADRWKIIRILHILSGFAIFYIPQVDLLFWVIFLAMMFYMPTISSIKFSGLYF
jgi:NHS family xanthosine MFS transporter